MKISEVLHRAADERLSTGTDYHGYMYSCDAIGCSQMSTLRFVGNLGVNTDGFHQFDEFHIGQERQGARYLWLKFAALVAEDEGL
jgi:hypothetical protein